MDLSCICKNELVGFNQVKSMILLDRGSKDILSVQNFSHFLRTESSADMALRRPIAMD